MFTIVQRLRLPAITILCGCVLVGAAYFVFEATTVLNMAIVLVVLSALPRNIWHVHVVGNLDVLAIGFIILSMFVFFMPALVIAKVCERRISDTVTSLLVIGWLAIYLFLYMFYPLAEPL